jgi:hypothetical protein
MPNHITHTMRVTGPVEAVACFRDVHLVVHPEAQRTNWKHEPMWNADGSPQMEPSYIQFDFETVIPRPKIYDEIEASSLTSQAIEAITGVADDKFGFRQSWTDEQRQRYQQTLDNLKVEQLEAGRKALQAIEEHGAPTWYEWSIENWGCKWNSYDFVLVTDEPGELVFRFDTAWSTPVPVLETLAAMHPDLAFTTDSFDECWNFAAHGEASEGVFSEVVFEADKDAYEKAYGSPYEEDEEDAPFVKVEDVKREAIAPDPLGAPSEQPDVKKQNED